MKQNTTNNLPEDGLVWPEHVIITRTNELNMAASITMQTFNIYESCINKNEINNSVTFSQNTFNDYSLHSRIGHQKLLCEIITEQETLRGRFFF
jgi:hypothetical protein